MGRTAAAHEAQSRVLFVDFQGAEELGGALSKQNPKEAQAPRKPTAVTSGERPMRW